MSSTVVFNSMQRRARNRQKPAAARGNPSSWVGRQCAPQFPHLFGATALATGAALLDGEALFAIGREEIEAPSVRPFTTKFEALLQGKLTLTLRQLASEQAFNDPKRGDRAACHPD